MKCLMFTLAIIASGGFATVSLGATADQAPGGNRLLRWAVLATPEIQATGLADHVTAALAKAGLVLLERSDLEAALAEVKRGHFLEASDAKERLRLGQMLRADAFVVLALEKRQDKEFLRSVICDAGTGARLHWDVVSWKPTAVAEASNRIAGVIQQTRARLGNGNFRLIAVTPFLSRELSRRHNQWQVGLQRLLEQALLQCPGVAVLEIEEADAIRRELAVDGTTAVKDRALPLVVAGEFAIVEADRTVATNQEPVTLRIAIRTTGSTDAAPPVVDEEVAVSKLSVWFTSTVAPAILGRAAGPGLSAEEQAARLESRAAELSSFGEWILAASLREAVLLIEPDKADIRLAAAYDYFCELQKRVQIPHMYASMRPGPVISEEEWTKLVELRMKWWHSLAAHVETLIRKKHVNQHEASTLMGAVVDLAWRPFTQEDARRRPEAIDEPAMLFVKSALTALPELERKWGPAHVRPECERFRSRDGFFTSTGTLGSSTEPQHWDGAGIGGIVYGLPKIRETIRIGNGLSGKQVPMYDDSHTIDILFWYLLEAMPPDAAPEVALVTLMMESTSRFSTSQWEEIHARLVKSPKPFHQICGEAGSAVYRANAATEAGDLEAQVKRLQALLGKVKSRSPDFAKDRAHEELQRRLGWAIRDNREKLNRLQGNLVGKPGVRRESLYDPVVPAFLGQAIQFQRIDSVRPRWPEWMKCDDSLDVMWSRTEVCIMRERDRVETLFTVGANEFVFMARWDGRWIWVATNQEVQVWSREGKRVATFNVASGLPESNARVVQVRPDYGIPPILWIAPFAEGKCVIAGNLDERTWVALASVEAASKAGVSEPQVLVLHRASQVQGREAGGTDSIEQAFKPTWIATFSDLQGVQGPCVLVGRSVVSTGKPGWERFVEKPLVVWPEQSKVALWPEPIEGTFVASAGDTQYFSSGGKLLAVSLKNPGQPSVWIGEPPKSVPLHYRYFGFSSSTVWGGRLVGLGGHGWADVDPVLQKVRWLNERRTEPPDRFSQLGTSAHYGLITWTHESVGRRVNPPIPPDILHRVLIDSDEPPDLAAVYPYVPAEHREAHHEAAEEIRRLGGVVGNPWQDGATSTAVELPAAWKGADATWDLLARLHDIKTLLLHKAPLTDDQFAGIERLESLECLRVVDTPLTDKCLKHVGRLPRLHHLQLVGPGKGTTFTDAGLEHVASAPLDFINVFGEGFTDRFLEFAAAHKSVRIITFDGTRVTHAGVVAARKAQPRLEFFIGSK